MRTLAALLLVGSLLTGCGTDEDRTLTVLAAASLTEVFTGLAEDFEEAHPGVQVRLVFESSAAVADKAVDHAPGDVIATADEVTMRHAEDGGGLSGQPEQFATNVLELVAPPGSQAVGALTDLDRPEVDYVTCVRTAPCGAAADDLLEMHGVRHPPASREVDVKAVLARVVDGEADAGLVYRTDVRAAGDAVVGFEVPGAAASPNTYWAAVTAAAREDDLAGAWIDLLLGSEGRRVLDDAGFGPPVAP